jgi:hypothetical protein
MNAEQWNARYPVGTPVFAYPGARPEDIPNARRLVTRTRTAAQVSCSGDPVVWVEGEGAYIALTHVDPVSESVWQAAREADATAAVVAALSPVPGAGCVVPVPVVSESPMTPERLAEIAARAEAATPGPWCTDAWEIYQGTEYEPGLSMWIGETCRGTTTLEQDRADAAFVAAARSDVPALLAEVACLRARVAELRAERADRQDEVSAAVGYTSGLEWSDLVGIVASNTTSLVQAERDVRALRARVAELVADREASDREYETATARIAELLAERHTTNAALVDTTVAQREAEASADRLTRMLAPTQTPHEDKPAEAFVPRTERSYWVAIADALNAAHAVGMPVGIDLDGTLTDHRTWSVVWDRHVERWTVAGYEDDAEQAAAADPCHPCGCPKRFDRHAWGCPTQAAGAGGAS